MRAGCSICLCSVVACGGDDSDPSSGHSGAVSATECGHVFHEACLQTWLENSRSCPTCRKQLRRDRVVRLFLDTGGRIPADGGNELQSLRQQLAEIKSKLRETARKEEALIEQLRSNVQRAHSLVLKNNVKHASTLRENVQLKADLRAMREDLRDRRQLRRENIALQAALGAKERELRSHASRMEAALKGELRRREAQIQTQARHMNHLEQEVQRLQMMLRCSDMRLPAIRQNSLKRTMSAADAFYPLSDSAAGPAPKHFRMGP